MMHFSLVLREHKEKKPKYFAPQMQVKRDSFGHGKATLVLLYFIFMFLKNQLGLLLNLPAFKVCMIIN